MKGLLVGAVPRAMRRSLLRIRERTALAREPIRACDPGRLRPRATFDLGDAWSDPAVLADWPEAARRLGSMGLPEGRGEVNPGDRRAIYHLVRYLRPARVLEIGTHLGASTIHIASAMAGARGDGDTGGLALETVDIRDVNDPVERPWARNGAARSPADMVEALGYAGFARFVTSPSLAFMRDHGREPYDLVFLDGDHGAATVYREVVAALELLSDGGVILLHDYFPDLRPLWADRGVIPGPFLAVSRLVEEGSPLTALPFGDLPWPTKQGSHASSLALLVRSGERDPRAASPIVR